MSTSNLQLPPQGVLITWVWDWEEKENDDAQVDFESREQYIQSESEESGDENTGSSPVPMHSNVLVRPMTALLRSVFVKLVK